MIIFVGTAAHLYTHKWVARRLPAVRRLSYAEVFARRSLPRATYIFTDFDRLTFWQLELAATLFLALREAGCRVLNDPARALQRLALLRRLHRVGINSFKAWPATEADDVDAYPVFLRTGCAHRGVIGDLLEGPDTLRAALKDAVASGRPLADLMIVQYRAEPLASGVFRKCAMFRIAGRSVPALSVHEGRWTAKYGEVGVATEEDYAADLAQVRSLPAGEIVSRAFEVASIDYGRADYGWVAGRPEIYEINTNPTVSPMKGSHPYPSRLEAARYCWEQYADALSELDTTPAGGRVSCPLADARSLIPKRYRVAPGYLWSP